MPKKDQGDKSGPGDVDKTGGALQDLRQALTVSVDKTVFTIGGSIDIDTTTTSSSSSTTGVGSSALPVTIRWDHPDKNVSNDSGRTVTLPVGDDEEDQAKKFQKLVEECQPATFGKGKKDVLDEEYRKAGQMGTESFCTNFTPYEYGVIDTIVQALACSGDKGQADYRGIRAQLYKLNVYSGPSGKFKPHVDTPRSQEQMGSLVVCIPHPHEGGQLAVRHQGREVTYNWGPESVSAIQWAAFFSDCEHEVLEVTKGHRVTLTYNLYWTLHGPASMSEHLGALDQKSLPFYSALDKLMRCPEFLPEGGSVAFACVHAYPHSAGVSKDYLPHSLKGVDMAVYQALKRFTTDVTVDAILEEQKDEYDDYYEEKPKKQDLLAGGDRNVRLIDFEFEEDPTPEDLEYEHRDVVWINSRPDEKSHKELAVAYLIYGNESSLIVDYSFAVLIGKVGPLEKRLEGLQK